VTNQLQHDTTAPAGATTDATPPGRFDWVDAAKGFCMVLVVLLHVAGWYEVEVNEGEPTLWFGVSETFAPLRMPLFFFISGFLAGPSLMRTLAGTRRKTIGLFFVFTIWTLLFVSRLFLPAARGGEDAPSGWDVLLSVLLPTSFWYLWALPVFFLLAWLCVRLLGRFRAWALAPFAVLAIVAPLIDPATAHLLEAPLGRTELGSVAANLVWFYAGVCGGPLWMRIMTRARWWKVGVASAVYAALFALASTTDTLSELKFFLAPAALYAAAGMVALLNMNGRLMGALRRIGQLTLPVYIFHIFAISVLSAVVKLGGITGMIHSGPWSVILPPVLAAVILIASRLLGQLILGSRASWLLSAPDWLVGARPVRAPVSPADQARRGSDLRESRG